MTKKYGIEAMKHRINEQERGKGNNAKVVLENGDSMLLRIANLSTCGNTYLAHSWYNEHDKKNSVLPFACDSEKGEGHKDMFDLAAEYLLAQAKKRYNPDTYVKGKSTPDPDFLLGKKLEPSLRYQFGFFNLADGKPVIFDLSKKYGEKILTQIEKAGNKIDQYAYEITRTGSESNTDYSITPYLDDLTNEQAKHFSEVGNEFPTTLFESSMYFKPADKQLQDLTNIGFDVTNIGYSVPVASSSTEVANDVVDDNVPDVPLVDEYDTTEIDNLMSGSEAAS